VPGDTSAGTVTTSVDGGSILVTVALNAGIYVPRHTDDSQHHALVFDLPGVTSIDIHQTCPTRLTSRRKDPSGGNELGLSPSETSDYVVNFPKDKTPPGVQHAVVLTSTAPRPDAGFFRVRPAESSSRRPTSTATAKHRHVGALGAAVPEPRHLGGHCCSASAGSARPLRRSLPRGPPWPET